MELDKEVKEILDEDNRLIEKVRNYIFSEENWIYYFIHDDTVARLLYNHGHDWNDYVTLKINCIRGGCVDVSLIIDEDALEDDDTIFRIQRYIILSSFKSTVQFELSKNVKTVIEAKIKEREEAIKYHEEKIVDLKKQIEKLNEKLE